MQKHLSLLADVRGCMTRFDPLTPQIVAAQSEDGLTYDEMKAVLAECGMDIRKVVFDGSRGFQNAFYADFEQKSLLLDTLLQSESEGHRQYDGSKFPFPWLRSGPQKP